VILCSALSLQACLTNDKDDAAPDSPDGAWILAYSESSWYLDDAWGQDTVDMDTHEEYSMRLRILRGDTIIYAQYLMDGKHFDTLEFVTLDDSSHLIDDRDTVRWSFSKGRLVLEFRQPRLGRVWTVVNHLIPYTGEFPPSSWSAALPADALEPDDTPALALNVTVGATPQLRTLHVKDLDWMRFTAVAGVTYVLETFGNTDTFLEIYGPSTELMFAGDDDAGNGYNARLVWTASESGTAYFKVRRYGDYSVGPYRVSVRTQTAP
jgi:hypothetical protein